MHRFPHTVFVAAGLRTPFARGGGALASYDAISLSVPVVQAMADRAEPDLVVWGSVIPNLGWSNIAREIWLDAKLNPNVPAFSVVLACSTSMTARSEEHTSELQSLMRISYAVFCLKKKNNKPHTTHNHKQK